MDLWRGLLIENLLLVRQVHEEIDQITEQVKVDEASVGVCDFLKDELLRPHQVLSDLQVVMSRTNPYEL